LIPWGCALFKPINDQFYPLILIQVGQSTFSACRQSAQVAGLVPLARRWGPEAVHRQPPLFPRHFSRDRRRCGTKTVGVTGSKTAAATVPLLQSLIKTGEKSSNDSTVDVLLVRKDYLTQGRKSLQDLAN
jgi:hypothetical protein